jgi:hypothetical protein
MEFVYEMNYDADPQTVWAMSVDEGFIAGRCDAVGAEEVEISVQHRADGGVAVKVRRRLPTSLPSVASAILGEHVTVQDTHIWRGPDASGSRAGTFHGQVVGAPVHMAGTLQLTGAGKGDAAHSTLTIRGDIGVHVPVIGGRVAPHVAQMLRRNFDAEQEFARQWLIEHAGR